jgi:hypothetical protein
LRRDNSTLQVGVGLVSEKIRLRFGTPLLLAFHLQIGKF